MDCPLLPQLRAPMLRTLLKIVAVFGVAFSLILVESRQIGPYTSWFNNRMMDRANAAELLGKDESAVISKLGRADSVAEYLDHEGRRVKSFNYFPYPFLPFKKFQVHLTDGKVSFLERFDD